MSNVDPVFQEILTRIEAVVEPRWSRQEKLEQLISDFNPDYQEISELLDALFLNFKHRYSDGEWNRAEVLLESFKDKLCRVSQMNQEEDPE